MTAHIPYEDLPNHLARQYILAELPTDPNYQRFYFVRWDLIPDLGVDIFTHVLGPLLSVEFAVRLFCVSTILLIFFGVRSISRHFDRGASCLYRTVPILCYGGPVQYGFLNYCFGVGFALVLLGAYLRLRHNRTLAVLALFLPLSFALLLCHIAAFGLFGASVGALELFEALAVRRPAAINLRSLLAVGARAAGFLLPPFALYVLIGPGHEITRSIEFSSLREKLEGVAAITLFGAPQAEIGILVLAFVTLAVALVAGIVKPTAATFGVVGVQGVLWLVLPRHAMGGGFLDYRLPWAISLFALGTLRTGATPFRRPGSGALDSWVPPASSPRPSWSVQARTLTKPSWLVTALAITAASLCVARILALCVVWRNAEPIIAGIDQALDALPPGSRLLVVLGHKPSTSAGRSPPLTHMGAYAVAHRQAYEPDMFADIPGQILHFTSSYAHPWNSVPDVLEEIPPGFDDILVLNPEFASIAVGLPLSCERSGRQFQLFRIDRSPERKIVNRCP